jgi:outer membrane receptor protein involved in Fe transport
MRLRSIRVLACLWALSTLPALAQSGGLAVEVHDTAGKPLPEITVVLSNELGFVATTVALTDERGRAEFPVLRAGAGYHVEIQGAGYATLRFADLRVRIGEATALPVVLGAPTEERIEVRATAPPVELDQSHASARFSDAFVQDLPVAGRFYQNIVTLAPGVEDADGDGNPTVHGSRARDFKALVGGVSNVDPLTGQWMNRVNPNSIEEIEVIPAGAGVEFGRAQGGFAHIVQRQGSNQFEGVAEVLYGSSRLDSVDTADYESLQTGFQFSGPIVKDRAWFRLSHDWSRREDPVNTLSGTEIVETDLDTHADQITWQVSPRNKLAFSYQAYPYEIRNFGVSSLVAAESSQLRGWDGETYSLNWTVPYSSRILIESSAHWQELGVRIAPTEEGVANDCVIGLDALMQAECLDVQLSRVSGSASRTLDDERQRLTARGDVTAYLGRVLGATHQLKGGFIVENERYFRSLEQRARTRLFVVPPFTEVDGTVLEPGTFLSAQVAVPKTADVHATGVTWGLYLEDQLKPTSNLVITAGVRYDREEINSQGHEPFDPVAEQARYLDLVNGGYLPSVASNNAFTAYEGTVDLARNLAGVLGIPVADVQSSMSSLSQASEFWVHTRRLADIHLTNDNVSPYLGIAWDPTKDGKTKLAAVASRHYNNIPLGVPLIELEPVTTDLTFRLDPRDRSIARTYSGVSLGLSADMVDPDLETPYQDELFLSFEREIATETVLKLSYIDRRYRDQLQDADINRFTGDLGRCRLATAARPVPIETVSELELPEFAPGDGIVDDCVGATVAVPDNTPFRNTVFLPRPDGIADLYVANPGWVDLLLVGNSNSADYDAWVLEVIRRQYRNWELQFSYTWSESIGDGEDFLQEYGNDNALSEDERGYQSDDRRHVVKLTTTTIPVSGWRLGGALSWRSGLPYSLLVEELSLDAIPPAYGGLGAGTPARPRQVYVDGQRNDKRNDSFWNLDLKLVRDLRFARSVGAQVSAEVFNVFDDETYTIYNPALGIGRIVNGESEAYRREGRRWQLGLRVAF